MVTLSECDGFEWDAGNHSKIVRRMPTEVAESAFLGEPSVFFDEAHSLQEPRWLLFNKVAHRFVTLIFTVRHKKIRIISARFMHKKEVIKYGKKIR